LTTAAVGCGKSPYELAPVAGAVQIDGKPFTEGKVMFAPIAVGEDRKAGRAAFGRLAADGSYSLGTYEPDDGAVVGDHWVTIIRIKPESGEPTHPPAPPGQRQFTRIGVPRKVTVVAGQGNRIDIRLTRQEVNRFAMFDD
jgi:hypothetical protein